jgi:hypothetical protein
VRKILICSDFILEISYMSACSQKKKKHGSLQNEVEMFSHFFSVLPFCPEITTAKWAICNLAGCGFCIFS